MSSRTLCGVIGTDLASMSANTANGNARTPTRDLFSLKDKTAIVTGATGGIGLVVATALAESGASVVSVQIPNDPNSETLRQAIEGTGQSFKSFECNLLDAASIKECFERIWVAGIVPEILFHAAGITHRSMIVDTTVETLNRVRFWSPLSARHTKLMFSRSLISISRQHTSYAKLLLPGCSSWAGRARSSTSRLWLPSSCRPMSPFILAAKHLSRA